MIENTKRPFFTSETVLKPILLTREASARLVAAQAYPETETPDDVSTDPAVLVTLASRECSIKDNSFLVSVQVQPVLMATSIQPENPS